MQPDFKELIKALDFTYYWSENPDEKSIPELKSNLEKIKLYVQNPAIDRSIKEIETYMEKGKIGRALYFPKTKDWLRSQLLSILDAGSEVARSMQPEVSSAEKEAIYVNACRIAKTKKELQIQLEEGDKDWIKKVTPQVAEITRNVDMIIKILPWLKYTEAWRSFMFRRHIYVDYIQSEYLEPSQPTNTLTAIGQYAYAIAEEALIHCGIEGSKIEDVLNVELQTEIEKLRKRLNEKEKENIELMKQVKDLEVKKEEAEILKESIKEKDKKIAKLSTKLEELQKELEEVKIGMLPIDAKIEIKKRNNRIEELSQLLNSKEDYISSLEKKLEEKEKEAEELRKRELKVYPRLREEDMNSLGEVVKDLNVSVNLREQRKNIQPYFDKAYKIYQMIHAYRVVSGDAGKEDIELLRTFFDFQDALKSVDLTSQPNESIEIASRNLYASYVTWRNYVKTQMEISRQLSHLD